MIACDDEEDDSDNAHVQRIKKGNFTKKFNECGYKGYQKRPQLILNQANAYIVNTWAKPFKLIQTMTQQHVFAKKLQFDYFKLLALMRVKKVVKKNWCFNH